MASLTLQNISKTFGTVSAVDNVSLQVADGEFVALLGPSGCGKTTMLRMIAGLEVPDSGRILIGERDVTALPPRDRDIAMVFQDYALYPHMTVLENIGYPLKVRGVPKADLRQRVEEVARNLQIAELLDRRPSQLSGGQQQRASVARAVVHPSNVFLFDEPLSNLDAKLRLEARAFLKYLQHEVNVTAVYVTHDQAEAMALADRIVVMRAGHVMQAGTPLDVYRSPVNTFVASFIGNPPMNLLQCDLDLTASQLYIRDAGSAVPLTALNPERLARLSRSQPLTLGIRPEHIRLATEPAPNAIPCRLYVTQPLGGESLVITRLGETLVSVRIFQDEPPTLPESLWLVFDFEQVFFYGEDGERLA